MTKTQLTKMTNTQLRDLALKTNPNAKVPKKFKDKATAVAAVTKILKAAKPKKAATKKVVTKKVAAKKTTTKKKETTMGNATERRQALVKALRKSSKTVRELATELSTTPKNITNDLFAIRNNLDKFIENDETLQGTQEGKTKVFSVTVEK